MLNSCNYLKYRAINFGSDIASTANKEKGMELVPQNEQLKINLEFSNAFAYKNPGSLLEAINKLLPSPSITTKTNKNGNNSNDYTIQINDDGHIQINKNKNGKEKHLFVKSSELDPEVFCELSKRAIGEGLRYRAPWPQKIWPEYIGKEWPPDEKMLNSKIKIAGKFIDDSGRETRFIENLNPNDNLFGIETKAIISKDPKDSSITFVVQQDNTTGKHHFGPWIVAPVKVEYSENTDNPNSLIAFYEHKDDKKTEDAFPIKNFRWEDFPLDRSVNSKIILANPCANGPLEEPKYLGKGTNWTFSANRGDEEVILLRSLGKHDDHFQAYAEQQEYVELQYTGPLVPKGEKSNVIMKIDFIPLKELTDDEFSVFGETGNIKNEVITVAKKLHKKGIVKG